MFTKSNIVFLVKYLIPIIAIILTYLSYIYSRRKPKVSYRLIRSNKFIDIPTFLQSTCSEFCELNIFNEGEVHAENLTAVINCDNIITSADFKGAAQASISFNGNQLKLTTSILNPSEHVTVEFICNGTHCTGSCIKKSVITHKAGKGVKKDVLPWFMLKIGCIEISFNSFTNKLNIKIL